MTPVGNDPQGFFVLSPYFSPFDRLDVPLARACKIFRDAYQKVSGLACTVPRAKHGGRRCKIQTVGGKEVAGQKVFGLNMLQARKPERQALAGAMELRN